MKLFFALLASCLSPALGWAVPEEEKQPAYALPLSRSPAPHSRTGAREVARKHADARRVPTPLAGEARLQKLEKEGQLKKPPHVRDSGAMQPSPS